LTREPAGAVTIRAIGEGKIRVGETTYEQPVALTDDRVLGKWEATPIAELTVGHFRDLIALAPEVIVLGTGAVQEFAPRGLVFALARASIGFEVMTSAAAARTFNVLAGEGRKVTAVLYP
jgi:uncharacterized protein